MMQVGARTVGGAAACTVHVSDAAACHPVSGMEIWCTQVETHTAVACEVTRKHGTTNSLCEAQVWVPASLGEGRAAVTRDPTVKHQGTVSEGGPVICTGRPATPQGQVSGELWQVRGGGRASNAHSLPRRLRGLFCPPTDPYVG